MEKTYRLEFSEKQQWLRLDNGTHEPNTNGFKTIIDHCTDYEFRILEAFLNRTNHAILTGSYICVAVKEVKGFLKNLQEYNMHIVQR